MKGFEPGFLEKLFDDDPKVGLSSVSLRRLSLDELKGSVAREVEALLNTRVAARDVDPARYPQCQRSLVTYGLLDISGLSLASFYDRQRICKSIEEAIARHEPRLKGVRVLLITNERSTSVLHFSIQAMLVAKELDEPVSFDATLQPSTMQYAVKKSARGAVRA